MRVIILGGLLWSLAFSCAAAGLDYGQKTSLFVSYAFGAAPDSAAQKHTGLRYGIQFDQDWTGRSAQSSPPLIRWQFQKLHFDRLAISGSPVLTQDMILRADDNGGPLHYVKDHIGAIAIAVAGAVVVYTAVDSRSNSGGNRDLGDATRPPGSGEVNCIPASNPSCPQPN